MNAAHSPWHFLCLINSVHNKDINIWAARTESLARNAVLSDTIRATAVCFEQQVIDQPGTAEPPLDATLALSLVHGAVAVGDGFWLVPKKLKKPSARLALLSMSAVVSGCQRLWARAQLWRRHHDRMMHHAAYFRDPFEFRTCADIPGWRTKFSIFENECLWLVFSLTSTWHHWSSRSNLYRLNNYTELLLLAHFQFHVDAQIYWSRRSFSFFLLFIIIECSSFLREALEHLTHDARQGSTREYR